ncbi:hypothetical protein Tco_0002624 [Tanacetum coccineum]
MLVLLVFLSQEETQESLSSLSNEKGGFEAKQEELLQSSYKRFQDTPKFLIYMPVKGSLATFELTSSLDDENGVDWLPKQVMFGHLKCSEILATSSISKCCSTSRVLLILNVRFLPWYDKLSRDCLTYKGLLTSKVTAEPHAAWLLFLNHPNDYTPQMCFQTSGGMSTMFKKKIQHILSLMILLIKSCCNPDLERKSEETEEVTIKEKKLLNVKRRNRRIGFRRQLKVTARQAHYSKDLNFEDEAGPSKPTPSNSRPRGLSIPGPIQTQPQQPTQGQASIKDSSKTLFNGYGERKEMFERKEMQKTLKEKKATISEEQPSRSLIRTETIDETLEITFRVETYERVYT